MGKNEHEGGSQTDVLTAEKVKTNWRKAVYIMLATMAISGVLFLGHARAANNDVLVALSVGRENCFVDDGSCFASYYGFVDQNGGAEGFLHYQANHLSDGQCKYFHSGKVNGFMCLP